MGLFGRKKEKTSQPDRLQAEEQKAADYIRAAAAKGGSGLFKEVANAMEVLEEQQKAVISPESAQRVVLANARLIKACEAYMDSRKGAFTADGKERLEAVTRLCEQQKEKNLDEMRDLREVKKHLGEKWEDLKVSIPVVELEVGGEVVGANVNRRFKTELGGKTGFFTERRELLTWEQQMELLTGSEQDPRRRDIYETNKDWLKKKLEPVTQDTNPLKSVMAPENQMRYHLADTWQAMDQSDPQFGILRDLVGKIPAETARLLDDYRGDVKRLEEDNTISPADRESKKAEAFGNQVRKHIPGDYQQRLMTGDGGTRQFLMGLAAFEPETSKELVETASIRADLIEEKARLDERTIEGAVRAVAINNFVRDETAVKDCAGTIRAIAASDTAAGVATLERGKNDELTDRNVATSRVAELLGVGNIVAHSQKIVVKSGDKTMEGCFMEFAQGTDFFSTKEADRRMIAEEVAFSRNAGFYKDQTTMEMLDYICGQKDRNAANMFYKLGDPGPDGTRNIIGLQGIDNDLAFGSYGDMSNPGEEVQANMEVLRSDLKAQYFIDRHLAEAIQGLDREKLEFALGDLIPKKKLDLMWERTKCAKEHIKEHMTVLDGDEWEMNRYNLEDYMLPREKTTAAQRILSKEDSRLLRTEFVKHMTRPVYLDVERVKELKTQNPDEYKYVMGLWDREISEDTVILMHKYNGMMNQIKDIRKDLEAVKGKEAAPRDAGAKREQKQPVRREISLNDFAAGTPKPQAKIPRKPQTPRPQGPVIGVHEKKGPSR